MKDVLSNLLILQDRDRKRTQLQREIADIPARKQEIEDMLSDTRRRIEENENRRKTLTARMKEIEVEIDSRKEKINRMRKQQFEIKSNDEYRALEKEIETVSGEITEQEDREIEAMEELEQTRIECGELDRELKEEEENVRAEIASLDERLSHIEKDIAEVEADRKAKAAEVDARILGQYEKVMNHFSDFAVVPVESDGTCGGCHMKLPPQLKHDILRGERLVTCSYCGRFLHIP